MLMRKLIVLKYPKGGNIDFSQDPEFRNVVVWLEDQKIRKMKIQDRSGLRDISSDGWDKTANNYLKSLGCRYQIGKDERPAVVDWLCAYAVNIIFKQNSEKNNKVYADDIVKKREMEESMSKLNVNDYREHIGRLAKTLQIQEHPDNPEITLKAVRILVEERIKDYNPSSGDDDDSEVKKTRIALNKQDLGFETGSLELDNLARVLRLLHINELRSLQTEVNAAIVGVQSLTANPKTNQKLGRVGYS